MLKKTTLLSIATAAAVITSSVGTFAAYDTVTAEATGLSASDFDFNVTDSSDGANSGCTGGGTSWTDSDLTGTNQYTVTATLKAESASKLNSAAGDVKITVTGTLS